MSKWRAFEPLGGVLGLKLKEMIKKKVFLVYILIDFQATLQATKAS